MLPDGTLINGFNLIHAITNRHGTRGYNVALMRSPDKGVTWSREIFVNRLLVDEVTDPDDGHDVRTGDILPDWAVDRGSNPSTRGNVYVVWMDRRFNDADHNDILLARSTDGGLTWGARWSSTARRAASTRSRRWSTSTAMGASPSYYDFRNDRPGDAAVDRLCGSRTRTTED